MDDKLIPVEGNPQLHRDPSTDAIINTSDAEYSAYMKLRNQKLRELEERNKKLEKINEIDKIKSEVSEIKDMMRYIVSKLDDK